MKTTSTVVVLAFAGLIVSGPSPCSAGEDRPAGTIAFSSLAPRGWDLYVTELESRQSRRLTDHPALDSLFVAVGVALILVVLLRFGLLACVFMQFFTLAFYLFPMTTDFSVWYAGSTAFASISRFASRIHGK